MSRKGIAIGVGVIVLLVVMVVLASVALLGIGSQRAESQYTGHVVDVVEDKGIFLRPSWVNMKTDPRSSDIQQFCLHPSNEGELIDRFYAAMESGERMTVTYDRPLWVPPWDCARGQAILRDIRPANVSGG